MKNKSSFLYFVLFISGCGGGVEKDSGADLLHDEYSAPEISGDLADSAETLPDAVFDADEFIEPEIISDIAVDEFAQTDILEIDAELFEDLTEADTGICYFCGNLICETGCGEDITNCPFDCHECGNGKCEAAEGIENCPEDCCGTCGDSKCASYGKCKETKESCPEDCGGFICGSGTCDKGENPENCASDCAKYKCGNQVCEPTENPENCPADCNTGCGNCVCDKGESFESCPGDCGFCGDGYCSPCKGLNEDANTCNNDCCKMGEEVCNGKDDNCNDMVDEEGAVGCTDFYIDADKDGFGGKKKKCLCAPSEFYTAANSSDCDDTNSKVNPEALENCATPFDDDCDGDTNDLNAIGCINRYKDQDMDGAGGGEPECRCSPSGEYTLLIGGDCDDKNKNVNPFMKETCETQYDDDCDGNTNYEGAEGCIKYYYDEDKDGYGTDQFKCLCKPDGFYSAAETGDCEDTDTSVNPGKKEDCSTADDDNCDGDDNDPDAKGCTDFYFDRDDDGFGISEKECRCKPYGLYTAAVSGDCDDFKSSVNPSEEENCATIYDDDCDSSGNDENSLYCMKFYKDADGDKYGDQSAWKCLCSGFAPYDAMVAGDCDDLNLSINPSANDIIDGIDNDCDGKTDNGWIINTSTVDSLGSVGKWTSIALDSGNHVHISYTDDDKYNLKYATNSSGSWENILIDSTAYTGDYSDIALDKNDKVHISYFSFNGLKYTTNVSGNWEIRLLDTGSGIDRWTSIAVDSGNKIHISYFGENLKALKYATNSSGTWLDSIIDSSGYVGMYTSIAADGNDKLHISYYDASNSVLKYATNISGTWKYSVLDSNFKAGTWTSLAVDSLIKVHISYHDENNYDLKYISNKTGNWIIQTVDSEGDVGMYSAIAVDKKDKVHISYLDSTKGFLKYAEQGSWMISAIDTLLEVGYFTSIAVGTDGKVHISYNDYTNQDLKYTSVAISCIPDCLEKTCGDDGCGGSCGTCSSDKICKNYQCVPDIGCGQQYASCKACVCGNDNYCCIVQWDSFCTTKCSSIPECVPVCTGDCTPTGPEICDEIDNDCNNKTDEENASGCKDYFYDGDNDEWGIISDKKCLCSESGNYRAVKSGDCNDSDAKINPDAKEICGNSVDDNCNGSQNDDGASGCKQYFRDADGDGYGLKSDSKCLCYAEGSYNVTDSSDCDDIKKYVNPAASEIIDGIDNNCNGYIDDVFIFELVDSNADVGTYNDIAVDSNNRVHVSYLDLDFYSLKYSTNESGKWESFTIDSSSFIEGQTSIAVDIDKRAHIAYTDVGKNDLKYATDKTGSWQTFTLDSAYDTGIYASLALNSNGKVFISYLHDSLNFLYLATDSSGTWETLAADSSYFVGERTSIAADPSGKVHISYLDNDNGTLKYATNKTGSWTFGYFDTAQSGNANSSIAADKNSNVHIAYYIETAKNIRYATDISGSWQYEIVDSDNWHNAVSLAVDSKNKPHIIYMDTEGSSYGMLKYSFKKAGTWQTAVVGKSENGHVGMYNSVAVDSADGIHMSFFLHEYYAIMYAYVPPPSCADKDSDADGHIDAACGGDDCDDDNKDINPDALEKCSTVYDDNCNGSVNDQNAEGCTVFHFDSDGDTYYHPEVLDSRCLCEPSGKYSGTKSGDCDDANPDANPSRTETCATQFDDDCNPANNNALDLPSCTKRYFDDDGDGYYAAGAASECRCTALDKFSATKPGDCNDNDFSLHPDSQEFLDGIDNNCDGKIDNAWTIEWIDAEDKAGEYSSISADMTGKIHISYFINGKNILKYATNSPGQWVLKSIDSSKQAGWYSSLAVDPITGTVHIAYYDFILKKLKYARQIVSIWTIFTVDSAPGMGEGLSLAIDSMAKQHICYFDGNNYDLKYATNKTGSWSFATLDSEGWVGQMNSIAMDSMDRVYISYAFYNTVQSAFYVKFATNVTGSWTVETLDKGENSSIDINSLNRPCISYCDPDSRRLKFAVKQPGSWVFAVIDSENDSCLDTSLKIGSNDKSHIAYMQGGEKNGLKYATDKSGSWLLVTVDSDPWTGLEPSLAIDKNDGVHISYGDMNNNDVKYAYYRMPVSCPKDADNDGFNDIACGGTDCNDGNPEINPGKTETCSTIYDDDCDGIANEPDTVGCTNFYRDADYDTFGDKNDKLCLCQPAMEYYVLPPDNTDCDDNNQSINPSASENCYSSDDDNCSGSTNDKDAVYCKSFFLDHDGDNYGVDDMLECWCEPSGEYRATVGGDCNDNDANMYPGNGC
jgi:hypothetical protein